MTEGSKEARGKAIKVNNRRKESAQHRVLVFLLIFPLFLLLHVLRPPAEPAP